MPVKTGREGCGLALRSVFNDLNVYEGLINREVDVLVVDSAHGHSANVIATTRQRDQTAMGH